jgi:hypothetical protein
VAIAKLAADSKLPATDEKAAAEAKLMADAERVRRLFNRVYAMWQLGIESDARY